MVLVLEISCCGYLKQTSLSADGLDYKAVVTSIAKAFPGRKASVFKYKDEDGDLCTLVEGTFEDFLGSAHSRGPDKADLQLDIILEEAKREAHAPARSTTLRSQRAPASQWEEDARDLEELLTTLELDTGDADAVEEEAQQSKKKRKKKGKRSSARTSEKEPADVEASANDESARTGSPLDESSAEAPHEEEANDASVHAAEKPDSEQHSLMSAVRDPGPEDAIEFDEATSERGGDTAWDEAEATTTWSQKDWTEWYEEQWRQHGWEEWSEEQWEAWTWTADSGDELTTENWDETWQEDEDPTLQGCSLHSAPQEDQLQQESIAASGQRSSRADDAGWRGQPFADAWSESDRQAVSPRSVGSRVSGPTSRSVGSRASGPTSRSAGSRASALTSVDGKESGLVLQGPRAEESPRQGDHASEDTEDVTEPQVWPSTPESTPSHTPRGHVETVWVPVSVWVPS
eukprot:TRINITY_DN16147_c0_g1_i1.p1 TRINITY_DN16147_c0_g1~~TRINITY_DN16147_c0_g1_i1.p1  ORF type:complete len:460 (+),score=100.03 TRINITY_DN16147_c0_g1_i1:84-1463(+)